MWRRVRAGSGIARDRASRPGSGSTAAGRLDSSRSGVLGSRVMQALVCTASMPRQIVSGVLGRLDRRFFLGPYAPVTLTDVPEPSLPADDWVVLRTRLCGI